MPVASSNLTSVGKLWRLVFVQMRVLVLNSYMVVQGRQDDEWKILRVAPSERMKPGVYKVRDFCGRSSAGRVVYGDPDALFYLALVEDAIVRVISTEMVPANGSWVQVPSGRPGSEIERR